VPERSSGYPGGNVLDAGPSSPEWESGSACKTDPHKEMPRNLYTSKCSNCGKWPRFCCSISLTIALISASESTAAVSGS
jgi:hypothetical protein